MAEDILDPELAADRGVRFFDARATAYRCSCGSYRDVFFTGAPATASLRSLLASETRLLLFGVYQLAPGAAAEAAPETALALAGALTAVEAAAYGTAGTGDGVRLVRGHPRHVLHLCAGDDALEVPLIGRVEAGTIRGAEVTDLIAPLAPSGPLRIFCVDLDLRAEFERTAHGHTAAAA